MREQRGRVALMRFILPVVVLAAAFAAAVALVLTRPSPEAAPIQERRFPVHTVIAQRTDFQPRIHHYGRLVASREVQLVTAVAGRVIEVSDQLRPGGLLAAGEVVARLDPTFYESELRQLAAVRAETEARLAQLTVEREAARLGVELVRQQLALAERELARQRRLMARTVASEKAVEAAEQSVLQLRDRLLESEARRDALSEQIRQQQAVLERLAAQMTWAERQLADTVVRAPFAAIVSEVQVEVGKELRPNDPIARIYGQDAVEIAFSLADSEFGRLWQDGLLGREVEAIWELGEVHYRLRGQITRVGARLDRTAAGIPVFAAITDNPGKVPLRPEAFVAVAVPDVTYTSVFVLPRTSLYGDDTVYVVEDGRLVPRRVQLVGRAEGRVIVRGALADGERVLATRLAEAGPGLPVHILP